MIKLPKKFIKNKISLSIVAALTAAPLAFADTPRLEEIIVTSTKTDQMMLDVPISVLAISGNKLNQAGISDLEGMTTMIPSLNFTQTGIGTTVSIRGISSGINQGFEQSVGQYVDGIYYGRAQLTRAPMVDMERVEVLRGPQSILFGKNSIAGAISMTTAKPSFEFEGSVGLLYEPDHGEEKIDLVLSGPFTDELRGRLTVFDRTIDGYIENTALNRDEQENDEQFIRGTLQWDATDEVGVTLKVEDGSFDTKGRNIDVLAKSELDGDGVNGYETLLNALSIGSGLPGYSFSDKGGDGKRVSNGDSSVNSMENITLSVDYTFGDYTVTSVTGYNAYDYKEHCDCDFLDAVVFDVDTLEDFEQYSQELRIASDSGETIEWIAGFFYQQNDLDFGDAINVPSNSLLGVTPLGSLAGTSTNRDFTQETDMWAVFAQTTWNMSDETRLTVGGRFTEESKEATRRQYHVDASGTDVGDSSPLLNALYAAFKIEAYDTVSDDRDETSFTPLITLQHDVSNDGMIYASYTTGYKSGGFDVRSNGHPDPAVGISGIEGVFEFDEEEAKSWELGGKFSLADGAAELNVALYSTEYTDLQTSQFDGVLGFNVTNAGEATVQGVEIDGRWQLTEGLMVSTAIAYLDFEYDTFPNNQCAYGQPPNGGTGPNAGLCDAAGKAREFAPELTGNLTADYVHALSDTLELSTTLDVIYSDSYMTSATLDPITEQDAYTKFNMRVALAAADGQWEVALVGKNLSDEKILTFSNTLPLSTSGLNGGGDPGVAYYGFYERSRSVAIQGKFNF